MLRMAKTLWSFGLSECNRVNDTYILLSFLAENICGTFASSPPFFSAKILPNLISCLRENFKESMKNNLS